LAPSARRSGFPTSRPAYKGLLADPKAFAKQVKLLFVSMGSEEENSFGRGNRTFHEALEKAGVKHVYYESPHTAHEWQTWRRSLYQFRSAAVSELNENHAMLWQATFPTNYEIETVDSRPDTVLTAQLCFAQATLSRDDARPATSNVPGQEYPKINSDLRVDFRLKAPDAQKVKVACRQGL
jgi:hypothetical protein